MNVRGNIGRHWHSFPWVTSAAVASGALLLVGALGCNQDALPVGADDAAFVDATAGSPDMAHTDLAGVDLHLRPPMFSRSMTPLPNNTGFSYAPADFNRDGEIDLALANEASGTGMFEFFAGHGDGMFGPPVKAGKEGGVKIAAADFDRDGKVDVVASSGAPGSSLLFFWGQGDGTFSAPQGVTVREHPRLIAVADFNRDGLPDVAVTREEANVVEVVLGLGKRTFAAPRAFSVPMLNYGHLIASDFNRDANPDILVVQPEGLSLLLGDGSGAFKTMTASEEQRLVLAAPGDVNGDGILDLIAATWTGRAEVLIGDGTGRFALFGSYPLADARVILVGDWNQDGRLDFAGATGKNAVEFLVGRGDGTFET
ncbi:MAG: VCBS repeat-containing protein, partial [Myxococcales bacterium]|nr:VCBS repeat-containing protein [Myxococcales bacterium]